MGSTAATAHTAIRGMARHFGLTLIGADFHDTQCVVQAGGVTLDDAMCRLVKQEIDGAHQRMVDDARAALPVEDMSVAEAISGMALRPSTRSLLRAELETGMGVSAERQSYQHLLLQLRAGGFERFWQETAALRIEGGATRLVAAMVSQLDAEALHVKTKVTDIVRQGQRFLVTTRHGSVFDACRVVVATHPAMWDTINFEPALTWPRGPQAGHVVKYLARVRGPLAKGTGRAFTDGPIGSVWTTSVQGEEAILVAFSGGPAAAACAAASDKHAFYREHLTALFPDFPACFIAGQYIDWAEGPHPCGGYAFAAPGELRDAAMAWNRPHEGLSFVGNFGNIGFAGFMEGAVRSGLEGAEAILTELSHAR